MAAPIEMLKNFLRTYHSNYTVDDVVLSSTKGYLRCTKPCTCTFPPFDGYVIGFPSGKNEPHCHTIGIHGVGYGYHNERGKFVSPFKLWNELHGLLRTVKA